MQRNEPGRKAKQQAIPSQLSLGNSLGEGTQVEVTRIMSVYSSSSTRKTSREANRTFGTLFFGPGGLLTWNTNIFLRIMPARMSLGQCYPEQMILSQIISLVSYLEGMIKLSSGYPHCRS